MTRAKKDEHKYRSIFLSPRKARAFWERQRAAENELMARTKAKSPQKKIPARSIAYSKLLDRVLKIRAQANKRRREAYAQHQKLCHAVIAAALEMYRSKARFKVVAPKRAPRALEAAKDFILAVGRLEAFETGTGRAQEKRDDFAEYMSGAP